MRRLFFVLVAVSMAWAVGQPGNVHAADRRAARVPTKTASTTKTTKTSTTTKTTKPTKTAKTKPGAQATQQSKAKGRGRIAARAREEKAPPPPMVGGRVAVFTFKGEGAPSPVRAEVVNVLRSKGLNVMTNLLPVDSADQYRDMAATLGLAAYVHGEVRDSGDRAKAVVHIRSGVTGRKIKSVRFSGASDQLPGDVGESLWSEVGPSFLRACADAAKPRKGGRAPMRIEAGTPIEPSDSEGT